MSISPFEYGDVPPPSYPNPGRKRKSGPAKGTNTAGKKKKEKENHEVACLVEIPNEETVEVIQEGMSYPQSNEEETQEAVEELMNELKGMVDQATQTPPPKPSLEDAFNSKVKLVRVYDSPEAFSQAMENKKKVNRSTYHSPAFGSDPETRDYHYMACPRHQVRLEEHVSQNGWEYVKCPMYPCLLFCAKEKALDYIREAHRQLHVDVFSL